MKKLIRKSLRERLLVISKKYDHNLCISCRLKSIAINEGSNKILTEEQKLNKLGTLLLMMEKEIKVGDNLTKKLNTINSDFSKKLIAFFNSNDIKDDAEIEYVDYDKNNEKLFTIGYTDRNGNPKTRLTKINTLLKYLGSTIQDIKDYEVEDLINHLKQVDTNQLKEVTGNDILKAYHCANYDEGETMGSCMRLDAAQEYLKMYTDNPNEVSCLVLINPENDKVRGRALIWHMDNNQYFMDRVYTTNKEFDTFFNNYADEKSISRRANSTITLENGGDYDYYPYMDTFKFYTPYHSLLSTDDGELELQDTNGGSSEAYTFYSGIHGVNIPEDDAIYSKHYSDWIRRSDAVNTWDDKWVLDDDAVRLDAGEHKDEYALDEDAVKDYEGDWITLEEGYILDAGEYKGAYALGDYIVELYGKKGIALRDESVELNAGKYSDEWCLRVDAHVLLEGEEIYGIISDDDMDDYDGVKYVDFNEFEGKGANAFNFDEIGDEKVSRFNNAKVALDKYNIELHKDYKTDKDRVIKVNKVNFGKEISKEYNVTMDGKKGDINLETLLNFINQGQLFESKNVIKQVLRDRLPINTYYHY